MPEAAIATTEPVIDRRQDLADLFDAAESGEDIAEVATRARDENGRFAPKAADKVETPVVAPVAAAPVVTEPAAPVVAAPVAPALTTWRKEYLPIQEKLAKGESLNPDEAKKLAEYNVERERQYSTGISTYKGEAAQAKQLTEAMSEFMPLLQQHNMNPATWIQNLGRAHAILVLGKPEQRIQMFAKLAQDYNIPLGAVAPAQQGQMDPVMLQLMQELQNTKQEISGITSWRKQQEDQIAQQEVAKFQDATKYPYFQQVRETMIELLQSGLAQNPEQAYAKATRLNDDVWSAEQQRLAASTTTTVHRQAAVGKAKAAGTQVRSAAPSGAPTGNAAKDRRSALAQAFEQADTTGRV